VKPTVDISDSLLREANLLAAHEGVTREILIERGLHCAVADSKSAAPGQRQGQWAAARTSERFLGSVARLDLRRSRLIAGMTVVNPLVGR